MSDAVRRIVRTPLATFGAIQAILLVWWAAFYPGLFSRDSVLYLSHTMAGPWVGDHSVLYDALMWLSFTRTGDLGALTLVQTTAMAGALTFLARSLTRIGAPPRTTTAVAILLPVLPPVGAFTVALWKDVPFTICAITVAAVACRGMNGRTLLGLAALFAGLGLFRANGFLVVAVAVVVLLLVIKTMRVRLALVGAVAAAVPLLLNNLVFPSAGIQAPSATYVYHTAFGDLAYAYRQHPERFGHQDVSVLGRVAPLSRWWEGGGSCASINDLIWRRDFSWEQAEANSAALLDMWRRLLLERTGEVIDARLCRGAIAWRVTADLAQKDGWTYMFSRRANADDYVGPYQVTDFPGRAEVFTLRPAAQWLNHAVNVWLETTYPVDWLMWRGALWAYVTYLAAALAAWAARRKAVIAVAAIVAGQQLAVLANISAQDFRYMASPIVVGALVLPLLVASVLRLVRQAAASAGAAVRRNTVSRDGEQPTLAPIPRPAPEREVAPVAVVAAPPDPAPAPAVSPHRWQRLPITGGFVCVWRPPAAARARRTTPAPRLRVVRRLAVRRSPRASEPRRHYAAVTS
ncbi:hypothetical protein GCM10022248_79180 [Nonomuraea soli]